MNLSIRLTPTPDGAIITTTASAGHAIAQHVEPLDDLPELSRREPQHGPAAPADPGDAPSMQLPLPFEA